jgi:hypothetical protein
MKFVPVLPYEPGNEIGADCIQDILEENFHVRFKNGTVSDECYD